MHDHDHAPTHVNVTPADVLAELSPEGQLHWEIAMLRATCKQLGTRNVALEAELARRDAGDGGASD